MNHKRSEHVALKFAAVVKVCVTNTNDVVLEWPNGTLHVWQAGPARELAAVQFDEVVAQVTRAIAMNVGTEDRPDIAELRSIHLETPKPPTPDGIEGSGPL
jgi:hypothetical protein